MKNVTWQILTRYGWPKETWPAEILAARNRWARPLVRNRSAQIRRQLDSGFRAVTGDATLVLTF